MGKMKIESLLDHPWSISNSSFHLNFCYTNSKKRIKEKMIMDPIFEMGLRLAELTARNTASAVFGRLTAIKVEHEDKKTIAVMQQLIQELLNDKQELEGIANAYQSELVAQKLTDEDLKFIVDTVMPAIEKFFNIAGSDEETLKNLESLKPLLSSNTLTVLQTLGFNYKNGVGEPLTKLVSSLISSKNNDEQARLNELVVKRDIEYLKVAQDVEAYERLLSLR